jgi:hypothetical protein
VTNGPFVRMLKAGAACLIGLSALACSSVPSAATPSRSTQASKPVVECDAGFDHATCDKAATVALLAVAKSGWTATHVWISSGSLAPVADLLFDPNANFPAPMVPGGGTNLGSAEVAFAENASHAGMNLAAVGPDIVADLIGYRVPRPGWCSGMCPVSSSMRVTFANAD